MTEPTGTSLPRSLLESHRNAVFVETGTHEGDGIEQALLAGFERVHSVEIDRSRALRAAKRFASVDKVYIHLGDAAVVLPHIMGGVFERATIWLDAHSCPPAEAGCGERRPLMRELEILFRTRRRDHTILVAERRLFPDLGVEERDVIDALRRINSKYLIGHADGVHHKLDILVATLPPWRPM